MTFKKSVLQCTSIVLLTALICGLVFICPVFALSDFSNQPLPYISSNQPSNTSGMLLVGTYNITSAGRPAQLYLGLFHDESDCYAFIVGNTIYVVSESQSSYVCFYSVELSDSYLFKNYSAFPNDNLVDGFYYLSQTFNYSPVFDLPSYSSLEDGIFAVKDYIENGGSSSDDLITASSYFGVPAGYAAYIELPSSSTDWDINVTQEFDDYSSLFGGQWSPMTSLWGFQSALPSGSGHFSKSGLTVIPMYKMKPYTVLGQSKTGFSNKSTMVANGFWSDFPSAKYLVIYNPVIRAVSGTVGGASIADNVYVYNKGISVTMSGYYSPVKYYKLESTVTTSGLESAPADGTFEDSEYTETFDSEGNSQGIVNSSGDSSTLEDGGGDLIPSATSIGDYVRNLNQTLNNFASNFIDLMTSPISHVQQLINAGTNYFNVIQGLYGWLPDEVHAVVKSGMVVALSIGVISVLL